MAELFHISLSRSSAIAASSGGRGINCHILHRGVPPDQPRRNGRGRSVGRRCRDWTRSLARMALARKTSSFRARPGGREGGRSGWRAL